MRLKLQSTVEFLTTYGWAFILIAIFISVVVVLLTPSSVTSLTPSSCYISPGLPCYSFSVFSNSSESTVTVSFLNNLGTQISFPNNGITVKIANYKNYTGVCLPANAVNGALVSCVAEMPGLSLPVGSQAYSVFTISYNLCSQGSCSSVVYNTSGSATASVSGLALTSPFSRIVYYVPITITNSQNTATPAPFQQMIQITESSFSNYLVYNNNFANFEFLTQTGQVLPAWIENNNSGTLTVWVKLPNGIPASSKLIIYLGFASKTTNLLSSSGTTGIGEAPQLSSTYAQYDDGASVFLIYGDFLNTAGFDGWTPYVTSGSFTPQATPYGIEMTNDVGSEGTHILPPNPLPEEPVIIEYSWNFYGGTGPTDGEILSLFGNTSSIVSYYPIVKCGGGLVASANSVMLMVEPVGMNCSGTYIPAILDTVNNKIVSDVNNLPSITPQTYTEKLIVSSSTSVEAGVVNEASALDNFSLINVPITMSGSIPYVFHFPTLMVAAGTGGGYDYNYVKWLIAMAYPPSGIMPSVSFGAVTSA